MLRKFPIHGFEDIAQLSIFHQYLISHITFHQYLNDIKMLLDATIGDTMMTIDAEQETKIIDALTSTKYQAQNDRLIEPKKGMMGHNTSNALLAQNKILTQ